MFATSSAQIQEISDLVKHQKEVGAESTSSKPQPKPFLDTGLGRLAPEIRRMIFLELLTTAPSNASDDFAINSSEPKTARKAPTKFVHIKASWYQVTQTCRQIYLESHPLFFASKAYYLANPEEMTVFLVARLWLPLFPSDTITALCLKNVHEYDAHYLQDKLEDMFSVFSDPTYDQVNPFTLQKPEAKAYTYVPCSLCSSFGELKNLKTVCFYFPVGEELVHVNFLFGLTGMRRGLVEFLDARHWLIRPQKDEDVWETQYACFFKGDHGWDKNHQRICPDLLHDKLQVIDIDSRAPGLQEGEERYVEVQLQYGAKQQPLEASVGGHENDVSWRITPNFDHIDLFSEEFHQAQPEIPQDQVEDTALSETSEYDYPFPRFEADSHWAEEFSLLQLESENSRGLQSEIDTHQDEDRTLSALASEGGFDAPPKTQSDHQAEDSFSSRSFVSTTQKELAYTENRRLFPIDTDDEDDQVQIDTKASYHTPLLAKSQHSNEFLAESATEADHIQDNQSDKVKEGSHCANIKYLPGQKAKRLSDILDTRNSNTAEQIESHQKLQQLVRVGNQEQTEQDSHQEHKPSPPNATTQEHHVIDPCAASKTAPLTKKPQSPTSPKGSGLQSTSVQTGFVFLFLLLLMITSLPPEWLSNAHRDQKSSTQN